MKNIKTEIKKETLEKGSDGRTTQTMQKNNSKSDDGVAHKKKLKMTFAIQREIGKGATTTTTATTNTTTTTANYNYLL